MMCIGPVYQENISEGSLWISNSIDIIEIDNKKAWNAKDNIFIFKFHVARGFSNGKLHFVLPFNSHTPQIVAPDPELLGEVSQVQVDYLERAIGELQDGLHTDDDPWIFGEPQSVSELLDQPAPDDIQAIRVQLSAKMLKGVDDVYRSTNFDSKVRRTGSNGQLGHQITLGLQGHFVEGTTFAVGIICKDAEAEAYRGDNGGQAELVYAERSLIRDLRDPQLDRLVPLDVVPLAFMHVMLYFPQLVDTIVPNYGGRAPRSAILGGIVSPTGKKFVDGRTFVIFRPDANRNRHILTRWTMEDPYKRFLNDTRVQTLAIIAGLSSLVGAVAAILGLIVQILR